MIHINEIPFPFYKEPSGRFQAKLYFGGKANSLGTYETAKEAALAYDQAAIKAGKKESTLNFPEKKKKKKNTFHKKESTGRV